MENWINIAGIVVLGAFALSSLLNKGLSSKRAELVKTLQDTVNAYEEKVKAQDRKIEEMTKGHTDNIRLIGQLQGANELMTKLLQGRDDDAQTFKKTMMAAASITAETHKVVFEMGTKVSNFIESIDHSIALIEQHMKKPLRKQPVKAKKK